VLDAVLAFLPVALLLTLTPGVSMALVVRSAATGGRRAALAVIVGNSVSILTWAILAAVGVAAVVAASAEAYTAVKLVGAVVLVVLGLQALLHRSEERELPTTRGNFRDGVLTGVSNPKLGVFFAALFPQFVPDGVALLPAAVAMAATLIACDLVVYSALAWMVARARRAFVEGGWADRVERLTGAVLVALGLRVALES
jgi:threonine/homoserine/homoserine lactone efflux protein